MRGRRERGLARPGWLSQMPSHRQSLYFELGKNSRRKGCGAGFLRRWKNVRSPSYAAKQSGAQPSGTFSCRRIAGSELGAATVRSRNVTAGYVGLLTFWKRNRKHAPLPFLWRPLLILQYAHAPGQSLSSRGCLPVSKKPICLRACF